MSHEGVKFSDAWELAGPLADWIHETNHSYAESRMPALAWTSCLGSFHVDSSQRVQPPLNGAAPSPDSYRCLTLTLPLGL